MAKRFKVSTTADKKVRLYVGDIYHDLTTATASALSKGLATAVKSINTEKGGSE